MPENIKIEELTDTVKTYIITNFELLKYEALERSSFIWANLASTIILSVVGLLFVIFLSVGVGCFLSTVLDCAYLGYAIVAGFYLVILLIIGLGRKKFLEKPIRDSIIRQIMTIN